ncbi:c-type cytochrome [Arenibacter sp. GZD96]|uniref:DUF7133 domain-containing protein n=1 Tax=Aurantibrevibacter litoralis TaxID=3106030 RepID=UPI002AFFCB72|nr:c-type cytochrome [Arenibacter sp. GZD-96]MEA1786976.1 c-type cytochrome [Arenibacter sp. GZD-96]
MAIDFDEEGRIWVVELTGYMTDLQGSGEDTPTGSIKILEDLDNDGTMDHAKVFLDSLLMPRALALVYGGLLYAEPPNLWFVEIKDDKPINPVLVDSIYAAPGNPEHQPNGLLLNIDNWIYNAKSHFRYRRIQGQWQKEPTSFRGQWGITHDDFGRLYYNDNSRQLLGDYVLPNRVIRNKFHVPKNGINHILTDDQRVYPAHATAVNRGYANGVLNQDSLLIHTTAACGPLIYRGGLFGSQYDQNAFVCIPEGNLIKRNLLTFYGDHVVAKQAWEQKEFLTSLDEGFRPVNLSNGPDGAMYIVDMHRGLIAHHAYMSPYLKKKYKDMQLDTLVNYGRILKVSPSNNTKKDWPNLKQIPANHLVHLLKDRNGWIRDHAQHQLILQDVQAAIPELNSIVSNGTNPLAQIHALYTLEGLNGLSLETLLTAAQNSSPDVTAHALVLLESFVNKINETKVLRLFQNLLAKEELTIDLYLSATIGVWIPTNEKEFLPILLQLTRRYSNHPLFQDALLSGISDLSDALLHDLLVDHDALGVNFQNELRTILENRSHNTRNPIFTEKSINQDNRTNGALLYQQICASCHGFDGEGIDGMAPPLMKSEYLSDHEERLGLIILHGLKGPIHVKGKLYNLNHVMPGLNNNEHLTDKDISDIIAYITNAFSDTPKMLTPETIKRLRNVKPASAEEYTIEELEKSLKSLNSAE